MVYHGPREEVLDFFESQGFGCPKETGLADFMQEVTSRKDQQVWADCSATFICSVLSEQWAMCMQMLCALPAWHAWSLEAC